jgi:S-adenosylmethionine:tRNA ribosyltransferase-isomerase
MRRADFHYELPPELIAQQPPAQRSAGRLLQLAGDALEDRGVGDLPELLEPGDLLVFNDTRVIPARLLAHKASGGHAEILIERILDELHALAQVRASKPPKPGSAIVLRDDARFVVEGREGEFYRLRLEAGVPLHELLERDGRVPLPPYIDRPDTALDRERYQTVFAREPGAVAAPTAGLHFDAPLLERLRARGVRTATLTLHVGAGTFQPVRVDDLSQHRMHAERYALTPELCDAVATAKAAGRHVVAVGTTVVRALESAARDGSLRPGAGETRLFVTPGFEFRVVDRLLTNFHLPESTLLMLVCAFGGSERVMRAYRHAVAQRYRFFSYGDAMLTGLAGSPVLRS